MVGVSTDSSQAGSAKSKAKGSVSNSTMEEKAFAMGLQDVCPRCGAEGFAGADEQAEHLGQCADALRIKARTCVLYTRRACAFRNTGYHGDCVEDQCNIWLSEGGLPGSVAFGFVNYLPGQKPPKQGFGLMTSSETKPPIFQLPYGHGHSLLRKLSHLSRIGILFSSFTPGDIL